MGRRGVRHSQTYGVLFLLLAGGVARAADAPKINYTDHVLPIFRSSCLNCHNPDKKKGGLDLSSYSATIAGSDANKVVNPGDPDGSLLYKVVMHIEEPKMPQKADKLPAKELDLIKTWIAGGALETASGKPAIAAKPKLDLSVVASSIGKPVGPPPMPKVLPPSELVQVKRPGPLNALAASPWAPLVAIGGEKQVVLYNSDTLELLGTLPFAEGIPDVLSFSRNGSLLLAGGGQGAKLGRVVLFEVASGKRITELGDEYDVVLAADLSGDQSKVALGGPSKLLRVYSTADGKPLASVKKHTDWVTAISFSPDGKYLASGDRAGNLYIWDKNARELFSLTGHKGSITALAFRDDSAVLASASEDGTIKLWNAKEGTQVKTWNAHAGGVLSMNFAHDGRLISCGRDKLTKMWKADGTAEKSFEAFADIALRTTFTHDAQRAVAGDFSGAIRVFQTADAKAVGELKANPPALPSVGDRVGALEKQLAELQTVAENASAEYAKAKEASDKAAAALAAAKGGASETGSKERAAAQQALKGANEELAASQGAVQKLGEKLNKEQAEAKRLGDAANTAATARDKAQAEYQGLRERASSRQLIANSLASAAKVAKTEAEKHPDDKGLAEAAAKAQASAQSAADDYATAKKSYGGLKERAVQLESAARKAETEAKGAQSALAATQKQVEKETAALAVAKEKVKGAQEALAKAPPEAPAPDPKALAALEEQAKAAADRAAKAKQGADEAWSRLAGIKSELERLKSRSAAQR